MAARKPDWFNRTAGTPVGVAAPNRHKRATGASVPHQDRWIDPTRRDPPPPPVGVKAFGGVAYERDMGKVKRLQTWVPWEVFREMKSFCAERDISMSSYVTDLIVKDMERQKIR